MADVQELIAMDPDELENRLAETRRELFNLRFQLATGQLDNTSAMGRAKRDVARILTIMRQRDIEAIEGHEFDNAVAEPIARRSTKAEPVEVLDEVDADDDGDEEE